MNKILGNIIRTLPLHVEAIVWEKDVLTIIGKNWRFISWGSWKITDSEKLLCGCFDRESHETLKQLANASIVSVVPQSRSLPIDPIFVFENGLKLEIFSTGRSDVWNFEG